MPRPAPGLPARHRPDHHVTTGIGIRRAVDLAVRPDLTWHRISAGDGAKGHRWYHWALIDLAAADPDHDQHGGHHGLLVRRARSGELAFYRVWTLAATPLAELVRMAGRRWAIEEAFQAGNGLAGLDKHQVRRWTWWRRWTVLVRQPQFGDLRRVAVTWDGHLKSVQGLCGTLWILRWPSGTA